ncbi:MAG: MOSC N-terminal beta barrel domain-containing protein [Cyanobacteria bacterium P01_H01_bin.15]
MLLSEINIYPIKSCRGSKEISAEVTPKGLQGDREYLLIDENGKFLTQRQYPALARIQVTLNFDRLILQREEVDTFTLRPRKDGKERPITIWRDETIAIDQGDRVADWFKQALDIPDKRLRLVKQSPEHPRPVDPKYGQPEDQVSFADGFPLLLIGTASLAELNRRLREQSVPAVPMNRFRPNLVVETEEPFIEDTWQKIAIGEVEFSVVKPCTRCIVTTTNQYSGERRPDKEPLKTLSTFRKTAAGITFGQNLIPLNTGTIGVGQDIVVL